MLKNLIICALSVTCALLTVRLWFGNFLIHGLFPDEPLVVAASPAHQRMAGGMIESARMTINYDDGQRYQVVYSSLHDHEAWWISARAISALIDEGDFESSGIVVDGGTVSERPLSVGISIRYNFAMPTSFFREQFGQRPGFLSSVFGSFETLIIVPRLGGADFLFISEASGTTHRFRLNDAQIYDDFREYFARRAEEPDITEPIADLEIRSHNPIGEQMLHGTVRPFVLFFFPNPAAASDGVTINGVYTYKDSARVVKFYPNNVVEYNALLGTRSVGTVSLASSLLAALDMLDRDKASMQALHNPMNDVFLAGYSTGPMEGQWNFYFDYVVGGIPMEIDESISILNHAVEIRVINNSVVQYRRLMLTFYESVDGL